jgi:4-carboxymuconolactone decarboxylase
MRKASRPTTKSRTAKPAAKAVAKAASVSKTGRAAKTHPKAGTKGASRKSSAAAASAKKSASSSGRKTATRPAARLPALTERDFNPAQRALVEAIASGPRGKFDNSGPFAVFLHAPAFGDLAQKLGGYCRLETSLPPRLSEFAILVTARLWRAQYEWHAHAPIAAAAGIAAETIADLGAGRAPQRARPDERAIYAFIHELYRTRRVSDRTYDRVHRLFGDSGMVEFVGLLGYYALVAMSLNVFRMPIPADAPLPFPEPSSS